MNAVGLRTAGGLTFGHNCLAGIRLTRPYYEIHALVPAGKGYEALCERLSISYEAFPHTAWYPVWRLWFDHWSAPATAWRRGADVLLTLNNQPAAWSACPQIVVFQNPYYIYPVREWWRLMTSFERASLLLQKSLFGRTARGCAHVFTQTSVANRRLREQFGLPPERLGILPNTVSLEHEGEETPSGRAVARRMADAANGRIAVLTLARYYPHKGLEFILAVARRLKARGDRRFVFFITVEAEQHPGARALLAAIEQQGLTADVVNLGRIRIDELRSVYPRADICFVPSILECMSGSYLDALYFGLPIVTTDRDFAREVCGDRAEYFPPGDAEAAITLLVHAAERPRAAAPVGLQRHAWQEIWDRLAHVLESAAALREPRLPGPA
ncbi:MAG TPA: glycosyltransferase family 4 protein [Vicinamibacterales bacterium]|nr:glycosyltransferase family 4 protein [Vicinamibacterales bacterium]